ncbi:MAG: hypothetical protein EHM24_20315 [Acidobacteria bacterium]|nr:MAG: hypothetical protein EHM24_20315 [Acidobacteriota bacterium]
MSVGARLLLLISNALPLVHLAATVAAALWPGLGRWWRLSLVFGMLYLLPPLACRALKTFSRPAEGRLALGSRSFFAWWLMLQTQVIFVRLPFLEELIRFVPGLYSAWLRCWGSRIGRLTYWAAGLTILDRAYLDVGDDVVFGAGVRLNPHVLQAEADGTWLYLGTIRIGSGASIGGYALLSAGCEIDPKEQTHAFLILPPFTRWQGGRRSREFRRMASEARQASSVGPIGN